MIGLDWLTKLILLLCIIWLQCIILPIVVLSRGCLGAINHRSSTNAWETLDSSRLSLVGSHVLTHYSFSVHRVGVRLLCLFVLARSHTFEVQFRSQISARWQEFLLWQQTCIQVWTSSIWRRLKLTLGWQNPRQVFLREAQVALVFMQNHFSGIVAARVLSLVSASLWLSVVGLQSLLATYVRQQLLLIVYAKLAPRLLHDELSVCVLRLLRNTGWQGGLPMFVVKCSSTALHCKWL